MYPYELFFGITLYDVCLALGAAAALVVFRILADRMSVSQRATTLALGGGVAGFALGLFTATLLQAFYNLMAGEDFAIVENTGATFYGGLVGGILAFLAVYLGGGARLLPKGEAKKTLPLVSSLAAAVIALAHGIGRVGCFFAGCCHGAPTDSFLGVYMPMAGTRVLPTQLMEAVFLFALAAFLIYRTVKVGRTDGFFFYMMVYGFFRFFIEYLRGDYRGASLVSFLTPSQLIALLMVAVSLVYYLFLEGRGEKQKKPEEPEEPKEEAEA